MRPDRVRSTKRRAWFSGRLLRHIAGASVIGMRTQTPLSNADLQREGAEGAQKAQDDVKATSASLNAEKRAVDDIREGRPARYYFAPREAPGSEHFRTESVFNGLAARRKHFAMRSPPLAGIAQRHEPTPR